MDKSSIKFVSFSALVTLGVVFESFGIGWLTFLGLTLVLLAYITSSQKKLESNNISGVLALTLLAIAFLANDLNRGTAFTPQIMPLWYWAAIVISWTWAIIGEFLRWRKKSRTKHNTY